MTHFYSSSEKDEKGCDVISFLERKAKMEKTRLSFERIQMKNRVHQKKLAQERIESNKKILQHLKIQK